MIINDTIFIRFSSLTGYNKNQNLDIVVVSRALKQTMHVYDSGDKNSTRPLVITSEI